jgi:hypothetical protein
MIKPLPFIVKPAEPKEPFATVGDDRVGTLQIPLYGWITGEEAAIIGEIDPENRQYTENCAAAVDLATAAGISPVEAQMALVRIVASMFGIGQPLSEEDQDLKIRHWQITTPLIHLNKRLAADQNVRRVTAMIRRLEGCSEWTDADSRELPTTLQRAIADVAWQEEMAMNPPADPKEQLAQLEADLGKLRPEPSPLPDPTGEISTGSSETSTLPIPTPAESDSGSSPPATSSRRSRGATAAAARLSTPQS